MRKEVLVAGFIIVGTFLLAVFLLLWMPGSQGPLEEKVRFLLAGILIGFALGEFRELLKDQRERHRRIELLKSELLYLVSDCEMILSKYESWEPRGLLGKNAFTWGGVTMQSHLKWILEAYDNDRSRFVLPAAKETRNLLFTFHAYLRNEVIPYMISDASEQLKVGYRQRMGEERFKEMVRQSKVLLERL